MNIHYKLYSIANLLGYSLEGVRQLVQEVNQAIPDGVSYEEIHCAIRMIPVKERNVQGVAAYLLKNECILGDHYQTHKPATQIQITNHTASDSTNRTREITPKVVGVTFDGRQGVESVLPAS